MTVAFLEDQIKAQKTLSSAASEFVDFEQPCLHQKTGKEQFDLEEIALWKGSVQRKCC